MARSTALSFSGFLFLLLLTTSFRTALAWGKLGHQAVANVAWDLLDSATRHMVRQIINGSDQPNVHALCAEPCSPLAYVADWADTARYTHEYHWTGPMHYVDIQDATLPPQCQRSNGNDKKEQLTHDWRPICGFVPSRDCKGQFCAVGSIVNYTQQLLSDRDGSGSDSDDDDAYARKVAVMFVTHFVGDIHQPLHVSRQSDIGGNTIEVSVHNWTSTATNSSQSELRRQLRGRGGSGSRPISSTMVYPSRRAMRSSSHHALNLHAVWDDSMIDTFLEKAHDAQLGTQSTKPFVSLYAAAQTRRLTQKENRTALEQAMHHRIKQVQGGDEGITTWARWLACPHGHLSTCTAAWAQESWLLAQERAYVHVGGRQVVSGDVLDVVYYERNMPVVLEQLSVAAVRLAATLQVALGRPNHSMDWEF